MILYLCAQKKAVPALHPCGKAARALDQAGHSYEMKVVHGYRMALWTWPRHKRDRAEVRELSGTDEVPILLLDDGEVISGSGDIATWAKKNRPRATGPEPAGTS